jgi:hypothetical protein
MIMIPHPLEECVTAHLGQVKMPIFKDVALLVDTVLLSLHNTRSVEAAALHIALGDRCALDVAQVDAEVQAMYSPSSLG